MSNYTHSHLAAINPDHPLAFKLIPVRSAVLALAACIPDWQPADRSLRDGLPRIKADPNLGFVIDKDNPLHSVGELHNKRSGSVQALYDLDSLLTRVALAPWMAQAIDLADAVHDAVSDGFEAEDSKRAELREYCQRWGLRMRLPISFELEEACASGKRPESLSKGGFLVSPHGLFVCPPSITRDDSPQSE